LIIPTYIIIVQAPKTYPFPASMASLVASELGRRSLVVSFRRVQ